VSALTELSVALEAKRKLPPAEIRKALRKAAGATLEQVARACDVTPQAVLYWETGSMPRGENLTAYLEVLRVFREAMSGYQSPELTPEMRKPDSWPGLGSRYDNDDVESTTPSQRT
jgi:transcriptional regulator with XRE-family HTH domain